MAATLFRNAQVWDALSDEAYSGEVLVEGPDGLAVSFTPQAASLSAIAIAEAAKKAEAQTPSMGSEPSH